MRGMAIRSEDRVLGASNDDMILQVSLSLPDSRIRRSRPLRVLVQAILASLFPCSLSFIGDVRRAYFFILFFPFPPFFLACYSRASITRRRRVPTRLTGSR